MNPSADPCVLILGAGINGAALARELVLQGIAVDLVDAFDLATGATSKSSRLIHGGLRYLEYGEFDLVRESLEERRRLLALAPHRVRPLTLFLPVAHRWSGFVQSAARFLGWRWVGRPRPRGLWLVRLGLALYDWLAGDPVLPRHRRHELDDVGVPPFDRNTYRWACSYTDAQMLYPERFVIDMLEDARSIACDTGVRFDALPYHRVVKGSAGFEVVGPQGARRPCQPAVIVNASGAWGDRTLAELGESGPPLFSGTKGSHLVTNHRELVDALAGRGIYAEAADGRLVFVLPFGEAILIGTTDLPFPDPPEEAVATAEEIDYLLGLVNSLFAEIRLTREDVLLHYSGVRPLPHVGARAPSAVTRRHSIARSRLGDVPVFTLVGGKLTTCRSLAEEACDCLLRVLKRPRLADTRTRPYPGGKDYPETEAQLQQHWTELARSFGLLQSSLSAVWRLFGTRTATVLESARSELSTCLVGTDLPLGVVRWIVRHEWVTTLSDLVERRLLLVFEPRLSHQTLVALARLLREEGRIAAADGDRAVVEAMDRLRHYYGRRLDNDADDIEHRQPPH